MTQAFCPHGVDRFRDDCPSCGPSALSGKDGSVLDRQMREIMRLQNVLRVIRAIARGGNHDAVDLIAAKVDGAFETQLETD